MQKINIETYLKKKKLKKENTEKIDVAYQKISKEYQKNYREAKKYIYDKYIIIK